MKMKPETRRSVWERDGAVCQDCGDTVDEEKEAEIHHKKLLC